MTKSGRLGMLLLGAALLGVAAGGFLFTRFAARARNDPAIAYRNPSTLGKLLERARNAEGRGDRGSAIAAYRFVAAVGAGGGPELVPYVAAARAALNRLTGEPHP